MNLHTPRLLQNANRDSAMESMPAVAGSDASLQPAERKQLHFIHRLR